MVLKSETSSPTKDTGHCLMESLKRTVSPPSHPCRKLLLNIPTAPACTLPMMGSSRPSQAVQCLVGYSPRRDAKLQAALHPATACLPWPPEPLGKDCRAAPKRPNSKACSYSPDSWNGKVEEHRLGARKFQIQILTPLFI